MAVISASFAEVYKAIHKHKENDENDPPPCLRPIHNYPIVPETSARHKDAAIPPVTRQDFAVDFRAYMQLTTDSDWRTSNMFDVLQQMDLASVMMFQWYGNVEVFEARQDPNKAGQFIPGWEEAAKKHAARGFYILFNSHAVSRITWNGWARRTQIIISICLPRFPVAWAVITRANWARAWEGIVRVKGQTIREVEEWVAYGEADLHEGGVRCGVPANNVRVFRVKTRKPFLPLKSQNIPWRELGVGVLERPNLPWRELGGSIPFPIPKPPAQ